MASDDRKVYRLRGIFFRQEPLTWDEFVELHKLVKGTGGSLTTDVFELGKWLDKLIDEKLMLKIAGIILKVHEPTPVHKLLNRLAMRRIGYKQGDIGKIITSTPRFADVVRDFFLLNLAWLQTWLNTPMRSSTEIVEMSPAQVLRALTSISFTLAAATSIKQNGSGVSEPMPS